MRITMMLVAAAMLAGCGGSGGDDDTAEDTAGDTAGDTTGDTTTDTTADTAVDETPGEPIYGECLTDEECEDAGPCGAGYCDLHSLICAIRPPDADGDGYPAMEVEGVSCDGGTDCDDTDPHVSPEGTDWTYSCNWVDEDCDGIFASMDDDGDGYGDVNCGEDDCDDDDPFAFPGSAEACDAVDNDCDGDLLDVADADDDSDTVLDEACGGEDCDDTDPDMHPGVLDVCDGIDNDCDGEIDSALALSAGTRISNTSVTWDSVGDSSIVTWTGSEHGVAWGQLGAMSRLYFRRASLSGIPIGDPVLVTPEGAQVSGQPAIAWSGSEYGIAWSDTRLRSEIYFARISGAGVVTGPQQRMTITPTQYSDFPAIAWTGSEWGVVWKESTAGADADEIFLMRISADGSRVESDVQVTTGAVLFNGGPRISWSGSAFGAAWSDSRSGDTVVYFGMISSTGALLAESPLSTPGSGPLVSYFGPDIAWSGSEFAVTWPYELSGTDTDPLVSFTRISADGTPGPEVPVVMNGGSYTVMDDLFAEWTGAEYRLMWMNGPGGLMTASVSAGGIPGAIVATDIGAVGPELFPKAMVWNGTSMAFTTRFLDPVDMRDEIYLFLLEECD